MIVRLRDIAKPFLKVGTFGFGGGFGMLAMIRTECVKIKKWITDDELAIAVALGQMVPGPYVPHYCQYIGNLLRGVPGGATATVALLLPSFLIMIALSWIYLVYQALPGINFIFKGIGAVMTAIIIWAAYDMGRILIKNWKSAMIFVFSLILFSLKFDPILTVLISGVLMVAIDHIPSRKIFLAIPLFVFEPKKALDLFWVFFKTGAVIFGGGYAAIPFMEREACLTHHWVTPKEFLAGVALGQVTPGPVAITATFIGFKTMGLAGAFISTLAIFLPSFIILQVFIKIYKQVEHNRFIVSLFNGLKAAVVALLFWTGLYFAFINWHDWPYAVFGAAALVTLILFNLQPIILIAAGIIFGLILR
jgi:chromate transporter